MTHTVTNLEQENYGSVDAVLATIDITSLDNAGAETVDPDAEFGIEDAAEYGVSVRGQEDEALSINWDHVAGELAVLNTSDATDVTSTTDVGEVLLEVIGY